MVAKAALANSAGPKTELIDESMGKRGLGGKEIEGENNSNRTHCVSMRNWVCLFESGSRHVTGWLGTRYVEQVGKQLRDGSACLRSAGIKGARHHAQLCEMVKEQIQ